MDNSAERNKRIEEIRQLVSMGVYSTGLVVKLNFLLDEYDSQYERACRLQVERDKAIAERDELLYELREAQERGSLD